MTGVLYDPDNVKVGNAVLMLTPWILGDVAPIVADVTPLFTPADTAWADWVSAGATNEGFKMNVDVSTTQITIEEQSTPVDERQESKTLGLEAELAEDTLLSVKYAWGGSAITVTAAASGTPGTSKMVLADDVAYWTYCLEMQNKFGLARRIYVPKASMIGSGETSFRRASDKRMYPVRLTTLCRPSDIQIVDITAPALP
jgi:hypothetical protein